MIKSLIYYYIEFKTKSPLSVGNGETDLTDHDLIKDSKGEPFIPASTIAGVFRNYLSKEVEEIFIPDNKQSPFFISDAKIIDNTYKTSIRDGIRVGEDKISVDGNKYDIEILEQNTSFKFRIEVTIRENDDENKMKNLVESLIANLNAGNILIGMKSNRGFGKVEVTEFAKKEFTKNNFEEFYNFNKYIIDDYQSITILEVNLYDKYDTITIPLKQLGGISIRAYSAKVEDVDFEHIKSNNIPVIPGTSWNGLIRKQIEMYANYFHKKTGMKEGYTEYWFGKYDGSLASKVIIEESIIKDSKEIEITRNKIDRFSGGSADTALFSEKANFNGTTYLTIKLPKTINVKENNEIKEENNTYLKGLIMLTIKDIDNGLIALGGQTSIGRGIFKLNGKIKINEEEIDIDNLIFNMFEDMGVKNG